VSIDKAMRGAVAPLRRALWRTIRRGIIGLTDVAAMVQVEGYDGERTSDVEYWQHYGLLTRPPKGTEVLVVQVGGGSEQPIAIATHNDGSTAAGRVDIESEESILYSKEATVHLSADGDVNLIPNGAKTVHVGGDASSCVYALVLGDTINLQLTTMLNLVSTALGKTPGADVTAAVAGISVFLAAQGTWLSQRSKTR